MEIVTQSGLAFLARWTHVLAGVTWVGILYYFNFVQVPAFAEMEPGARSEALRKITWRALWWFRWSALLTVLSGLTILGFNEQFDGDYFKTAPGLSISTGMLLGLTMFLNVWGVIWPAQKIAIGSARAVAEGGAADPGAAAAARRGFLASRANTIFSMPMLFFMAATSHFAGLSHFSADIAGSKMGMHWVIVLVLMALIELTALGRLGGYAPGGARMPFDTLRNALITGFALVAIFYASFEIAAAV